MALFLARWQFAIVTIFHFFFVPVTIGLGVLVAVLATLAHRHRGSDWERLTRFFSHIFLISMAVGVVTGIVLEFQFGLNWSRYSVFVGNIFGAPLAIEGLLAFFLESTFIGLWVFGRDRLPPRVHLATIWLVSIGTLLSAFFILAANAWMQHPVGYRVENGKAVLTNFWAVLGNSTLWWSFAHTVFAALATGGALMLGIAVYRSRRDSDDPPSRLAFRKAAMLAAGVTAAAGILTAVSGDGQARLMDTQQPMKMAAAEALYDTTRGASFSLLTIGDLSGNPIFQIRVPGLLSLIATLNPEGEVLGIHQIQQAEQARYGSGSYVPVIWLTYWSFRIMVGAGILLVLLPLWILWRMRRRTGFEGRWLQRIALAGIALPLVANTAGWIFTEAGRQPWIVYGLMTTASGVSTVPVADVAATLGSFVAVYTILGFIAAVLIARAARRPFVEPSQFGEDEVPELVY
ncbi:cytochrome bd quinol oxidase subunit 1 apoprotein [Acidothermus cellulolyticus 11B]|uniref:Cytochrome bd quinol oxidase subunit 1 apoprotein n=1 Tax=Acidothermus cellulolyticus (strain ATCC 43068 / DSM 8971 / 11B) TaxID=351607 RepID=A0LSG3_ACIC1|nr:cytochrome bd quinol oxidase subunit 1 apoprotein [Acidothermus cellulolyticus 11B]